MFRLSGCNAAEPIVRVQDILRPYQLYGGLQVNWRQFGSSGHDAKPQGGILRNYWKCYELGSDNNKCGLLPLLQLLSHLLLHCAGSVRH